MNAQAATVLKASSGEAVPLRGVKAYGRLNGLLFELCVEQVWENTHTRNIEAEYTFPVPHRAVLLGLELELDGRVLQAIATRRSAARADYEQAIDDGDSAALLEQAGDGLYSLSLGNLMAGERAVIRYRYAELLDRSGDEVRLMVPTVIAPRFGDAAAHGLQPQQVPHTDLQAEYPFEISIDILGSIAAAAIDSPSHAVTRHATEAGCQIRLSRQARLDRDFVLKLAGPVTRAASVVAPDHDGYVALVSIDPGLTEEAPAPLALKLLVDCSGSMTGDSIAAARRALLGCVARLEPRDHVSLSRFGSGVEHLTQGMIAASEVAKGGLGRYLEALQADMGGTALAEALTSTIGIPAAGESVRDILLVTDAEVWAVEQVVDTAARSGHRLFVVAVGAAPAEALSRQLAEKTGGACEFVAPGEDAEPPIMRMFRRLREAPKHIAEVTWPVKPLWQAPLPAAVFSGDTVHVLAGFAVPPVGEVRMRIAGLARGEVELGSTLSGTTEDAVVPRVAAARRLGAMGEEEATALAERYQLASRFTSYVVVQVRDAEGKAVDLPELRSVAQMLAEGWGGIGVSELGVERRMAPAMAPRGLVRRHVAASMSMSSDWSDGSNMMLREPTERFSLATPGRDLEFLTAVHARLSAGDGVPRDWDELSRMGASADVVAALRAIAESENLAAEVVIRAWIAMLAGGDAGASFSDEARDALIDLLPLERETRTLRRSLREWLDNSPIHPEW
ncbi:MAG: VWA domain-containing protein [Gammaproteobacteria bacterium]|nr:VWA domain-containing protein [Gammaproteobacteria bacterium]